MQLIEVNSELTWPEGEYPGFVTGYTFEFENSKQKIMLKSGLRGRNIPAMFSVCDGIASVKIYS